MKLPTPSPISSAQSKTVVKTALYIGGSAVVSYLISAIADNPYLFGALTPTINLLAVVLKQVFTKS